MLHSTRRQRKRQTVEEVAESKTDEISAGRCRAHGRVPPPGPALTVPVHTRHGEPRVPGPLLLATLRHVLLLLSRGAE
jgi:hypothetical protein